MTPTSIRAAQACLRPSSTRLLSPSISTPARFASNRLQHRPWIPSGTRFASTTTGASKGTWKGTFARWGLAVGAVYFYATNNMFEQKPAYMAVADSPLNEVVPPTLEQLAEEKKRRQRVADKPKKEALVEPKKVEDTTTSTEDASEHAEDAATDPAKLQAEAGQQGAFNPETGEINWDCPCLGGMAHGPCGEEFKAAFSCFVYSTAEPQGMDCIDKFKGMQDCFREHPDIYGSELEPDDEDEEESSAPPATTEGSEAEEVSQSTLEWNSKNKDLEPEKEPKKDDSAPAPLERTSSAKGDKTSEDTPKEESKHVDSAPAPLKRPNSKE